MTDLPSYRAEPDADFADRLERDLLRRLTDPAVSTLTEVPLVNDGREAADEVTGFDLEATERRRRPWRIRLVVGGLIAAGLVAVFVLAGRNNRESKPADAPTAGNGLIAFSGNPEDGVYPSDVYVLAPDGSGRRALTSTPELAEDMAAWSPDGSRLAFVRRPTNGGPAGSVCRNSCLVVVDPSTGVETFGVELPRVVGSGLQVPSTLAWSPDGNQIVVLLHDCGAGGCGAGNGGVVVDLPTGAVTRIRPTSGFAEWSLDGRWLYLEQPGDSILLVPADVVGTGDLLAADRLAGARVLPAPEGTQFGDVSGWSPDGSTLFVETGIVRRSDGAWEAGRGSVWIDVISIADGEHRTVIEDGFDGDVSPDGNQIAYSRAEAPGDVYAGDRREIWVAAIDGSDERRVTTSLTPPTWSPDGRLILASDDEGWFTVRPDGTGRTDITPHPADLDLSCCPIPLPSWRPLLPDSNVPEPTVTEGPVTTPPAGATTPAVDDAGKRVGFIGLPPEGATPSIPESGEIVVSIRSCVTPTRSGLGEPISEPTAIDRLPPLGELYVLADGRLIWLKYEDLAEGANPLSTGLLEQRLTPEGVELMRSEAHAAFSSSEPHRCGPGDYIVFYVPAGGGVEGNSIGVNEHLAKVMDPWSWLPATAWEDREITAYVPSTYLVTFTGEAPDLELDQLTAQLPAAAADLIDTKVWETQGIDDVFWQYATFTTDEAGALAAALDDAGLDQDGLSNAYELDYQFEHHDQSRETEVHIVFAVFDLEAMLREASEPPGS